MHFLVDGTPSFLDQHGYLKDLPIDSYPKDETGAMVKRVEIWKPERVSPKLAETLLGGSDKTCMALRANVLAQVEALGGVKAKWTNPCLNLIDRGYDEYHSGTRWILQVSLYRSDQQDSIKRVKRE